MATTSIPAIDPTAIYDVSLKRPVPMGLVTYRPDQTHRMDGRTVIAVVTAAGAAEIGDVLTASLVE